MPRELATRTAYRNLGRAVLPSSPPAAYFRAGGGQWFDLFTIDQTRPIKKQAPRETLCEKMARLGYEYFDDGGMDRNGFEDERWTLGGRVLLRCCIIDAHGHVSAAHGLTFEQARRKALQRAGFFDHV